MGVVAETKKKTDQRTKFVSELAADPVLNDGGLRWRVAQEGYRWKGRRSDRCLYPISRATRSTTPADVPDLFEQFARCDATEPAFTGFANEYGRLGGHAVLLKNQMHSSLAGETWEMWRDAHLQISRAVRLWRARTAHEVNQTVRRHVWKPELMDNPTLLENEEPVLWVCPDEAAELGFVSPMHLKEGDPLDAAKQFVRSWVTNGLDGHAKVQVVWHEKRKRFVWRAVPYSLLGLMWWQLGHALCDNVEIRECRFCGAPMEIGPGARRQSAQFCRVKCRVGNNRRVKQAKELRAKK